MRTLGVDPYLSPKRQRLLNLTRNIPTPEKVSRHGISDLFETLGLPVDQAMEFAILSIPHIHPQIPFKLPILQAEYFSFILTKEGRGVYSLDEHQFPFDSETFYFTNPGHIKSYELLESKQAYLITVTERFLEENVHPQIYEEFPFLLAEIVPPKKLTKTELEELDELYTQISNEFKKDSKYKKKILGNLMMIMLLKIKERFWSTYNPLEEGKRSSQIVTSFKTLVESEFKKILTEKHSGPRFQAQFFARELNLHPNYLNAVIKSKTGRTVNDWISARTLSVAKSLLVNTASSNKQIAHTLGFSEPTHFSRFFKKNTNLSPNAFRKLHAQAE
ncbi:MAG: helix-turn-helix domain-containing protein [Flammeovirgaceae bacterium]